jgi:phosphoglycerate-specific signal transduction histidine kinase
MLGDIVDLIILIGALCAAVYKIWDFFAKPTSKLKQRALNKEKERIKAVLEEELPVAFLAHDLETREKYKADRQQYLVDIKNEVVNTLGGSVTQNASDLEALKISARDVLREKIMCIYRRGKRTKEMDEDDRDALI